MSTDNRTSSEPVVESEFDGEYIPKTRQEINDYIADNENLIWKIVHDFDNADDVIEMEDRFQIISEGFFKGILSYSPSRHTKLSSYCFHCGKNAMIQAVRKATATSRSAPMYSLDAPIFSEHSSNIDKQHDSYAKAEITQEDVTVKSVSETLHEAGVKDAYLAVCKIAQDILTPFEQDVLFRSISGQRQADIAKATNSPQPIVCRTKKLAHSKLLFKLRQMGVNCCADLGF